MSQPPSDDLAMLLAPARAALRDERGVARSVRMARARTLTGAAPRQSRSSRPLRTIGAALVFAAFALMLSLLAPAWMRARGEAKPIAFAVEDMPGVVGERIASPMASPAPRTLDFDDGTRVELAAESALRVLSLDDRGGRLLIEHGTIRAAFQHRDRTRWAVEAGGIVVEVTGTRFDVSFDPTTQSFDLAMHEGSVRTRGCDIAKERIVRGTETLHASCAPTPVVLTPHDLPAAAPPEPATEPALIPAPATALPSATATATARPAATAGAVDSSMVLLERADALRRAGDPSGARAILLQLRERYPHGSGAAHAAFDLGVLAFDVDGRFADAARYFQRYLEEAPRGPLAREALGRLLEAQSRNGDSKAAATSATHYLAIYPGGPHASLAKRLGSSNP